MPIVLVDSDILIDFSRRIENAAEWIDNFESHSSLAISSITQMELFVGALNKSHLRETQEFLRRFQIVHVSEPVSILASELVLKFSLSHKLRVADAIIAATAISFDYDFATKNQRDFKFIGDLKLLPYP